VYRSRSFGVREARSWRIWNRSGVTARPRSAGLRARLHPRTDRSSDTGTTRRRRRSGAK
jgi:hypothetical protein